MKSLTIRDKTLIILLILCTFIYFGYNYIYIPLNQQTHIIKSKTEKLKGEIGDTQSLDEKLKQLNTQKDSTSKRILEIKGLEYGKSINKQEFLLFLGNECSKNNVNLINFNELGVTEIDNNIWKEKFDFEIRGDMTQLNTIFNHLENLGIKYSIQSLSLRQNENYPYLMRFFDEISKLEWYQDPIPPVEEPPIQTEDNNISFPEFEEPIIETPLPSTTPAPTIEPPPVPTPEVSPEPKNDSIEKRLDDLLELTSYKNIKYADDIMRLSVTIEFTMYSDPSLGGQTLQMNNI